MAQVQTKKVEGRRSVRYETLNDFLADAERMASVEVRRLGNWSPGQIYEHMARALDSSIDGMDFSLPLPVRWIMTLFMKKRFLKKELPSGFKTSSRFEPDEIATADALANLRNAVERQKQESSRVPHPAFGNISREEWTDFHLRHAEMHMSFLEEAN